MLHKAFRRFGVIGIWAIILLLVIGNWGLNNFAYGDTWSQSSFTDGTFNNTVTTTNNTDVTLKLMNYDSGNGTDGTITITTAKNINTDLFNRAWPDAVTATSMANTSSGATSIVVVSAPNGLAAGDEVIIISLKGTSGNVGFYEFARITSINVNTLNLNRALTNGYNGTLDKIMVQRVPNYTNVTIDSGSLTCSAWNGTWGGVLVFRATGTVTVNVVNGINTNAKGYLGGDSGTSAGSNSPGGEGYNGSGRKGGYANASAATGGTTVESGGAGGGGGATQSIGAGSGSAGTVGSGGGGGGGAYQSSVGFGKDSSSGAGGGGGNGSVGVGGGGAGAGGSGSTNTGGNGGSGSFNTSVAWAGGGGGGGTDGQANSSNLINRAYMGGGGGASGGENVPGYTTDYGYAGGNGGGIIFISANIINVINGASIAANGQAGANGRNVTFGSGGGGGGAGGSIILIAITITNPGASGITANGGAGGTGKFNGGNGGGGRTYAKYYGSAPANLPTPNYASASLAYFASGVYTSTAIAPTGVSYWGTLNHTKITPANTLLTVDVLSSSNNALLVANVPSGTDLMTAYPATFANITGIKLRANFSTSDTTQTATLSDWQLEYAAGTAVSTTNWSDIINGNSIQMGQSVAHVKFDMRTVEGTARWKRFRIDKGLKAYSTNIACPDCKIEIQVWMESDSNGFWDTGDTFISKGNFSNGTCYLNMKQWSITTTPKTYYIVYKLANDIGGGQRAGVKIADSSYLEFENATMRRSPLRGLRSPNEYRDIGVP
ncbi:MAG: hypothetical protein HY811_06950 [Planctomycetes bacterium]|nr:hypothetical protein [Planctomycetota bacterium]